MANKKITELPFIHTISGSNVFDNPTLNTVVPVVMYGTTNQITVENYAKFINLYNAHTGSAGNTFAGPQTINNNVTITGNTSIGGTLVVAGKITAQEFFTEITSASIIFESGSTIFGNSGDDTHTFTGSLLLNGVAVGAGELNAQTASQDLVNRGISSVTGSINTTTSSFDSVFLRISSTTGSINTTTSSFNSVFLGISSVTGAMNTQSSSQDLVNLGISSVTGSLIGITNGLMAFTAALDSTYATDAQLYQLYQATQSLELHSGSMIGITNGLMAFTAALDSTYATDAQLYQLYAETASIKAEIGGIEAYTASLKGAFTIDGNNDVYFTGKITTQEVHTTYTTSSVLFQSGSTKLGNSFDDKHEITGSLNTSFGGRGGLFVNDGFQKTFTFPTGNLFSIDFGSAEGGGFVDVTYGGVVTSIGGRGGATRYAIAYKNATDAVATKVHGYGDDIVSASISATKVAIFSIGGDAVQSAKYQLNVSVNAVAADGAGDYDVIQYKRL